MAFEGQDLPKQAIVRIEQLGGCVEVHAQRAFGRSQPQRTLVVDKARLTRHRNRRHIAKEARAVSIVVHQHDLIGTDHDHALAGLRLQDAHRALVDQQRRRRHLPRRKAAWRFAVQAGARGQHDALAIWISISANDVFAEEKIPLRQASKGALMQLGQARVRIEQQQRFTVVDQLDRQGHAARQIVKVAHDGHLPAQGGTQIKCPTQQIGLRQKVDLRARHADLAHDTERHFELGQHGKERGELPPTLARQKEAQLVRAADNKTTLGPKCDRAQPDRLGQVVRARHRIGVPMFPIKLDQAVPSGKVHQAVDALGHAVNLGPGAVRVVRKNLDRHVTVFVNNRRRGRQGRPKQRDQTKD